MAYQKFQSFKNFRLYINNSFSKTSSILRPKNISKTIEKAWSSAYRLPTYIFEPEFVNIFQYDTSVLPSKEEVSHRATQVRDDLFSQLTKQKPLPYLKQSKNFSKIQKAIANTSECLGLKNKKFRLATIDEAAENLPKSTSSGFPDYVKKSENLDFVKIQAFYVLNNFNCDWITWPVTLAWRTQNRLSDIKFRIIWVTSMLSQTFEMCMFKPIQTHFSENKDTAYCFGNVFNDLKPRIERLRNFKTIVSLDFTSFDQSIPFELMFLFFGVLKSNLILPTKAWNIQFDNVMNYNIFTNVFTLVSESPSLFTKTGTLSSGSVFTNYLGTWVNLFLINLYLIEKDIDYKDTCLNVLGDDQIFGFNFDFSVQDYSYWLLTNFDMVISVEKSQVYGPNFKMINFLGASINEEGRWIDPELVIKQLIISETFISEDEIPRDLRLISKAASICFKFTDGYLVFDWIVDKLKTNLNIQVLPEFYYELFRSQAGPFDEVPKRSILEYKYNGWMIQ